MSELVLYHHVQGLTEGVRSFADDVRRAGHTVHTPDVFDGRTFDTIDEGFVTVLGIAARNGIMLVSHYRHLEEVEGEKFGTPLVLRGAEERLTPILMTALATGLALVPLVLGGNLPGHEIEYPMAVVILGGIVTSTFLNMIVIPALYLKYGRSVLAKEEAEMGRERDVPSSALN